jgi:hypothetical protein
MKRVNHKWGVGARQTVQQVFQSAVGKYPYPTKSCDASYLRFERDVWASHRKRLKRDAVGMVRCMGAKHFFRGAYIGAEDD